MLERMKALLTAHRAKSDPKPAPAVDHAAEAHAFFAGRAVAMPPLTPPAAGNDDPLAGVAEVVERELRVAGYLR